MVKIPINGREYYYDGYLISNLDQLKKAVALKWDGVLLFGGYEGDGKTTLASQALYYLDPTFDLSRVCFSLDELARKMDELPPGSALLYDESWKDVSNINKFQSGQRKFIRVLTEKRKKRLYIGVVAATFFDLNKYFVIHRSRAYIHVYSKGLERGYFSFYNRDQKKDLYIKGRRDWNLAAASPSFRARFTNWLPFDSESYENKKDEGTKEAETEPRKPVVIPQKEFQKFAVRLVSWQHRNNWLKYGGKGASYHHLGVPERTARDWEFTMMEDDGLFSDMPKPESDESRREARHTTDYLPGLGPEGEGE